MSILPPDPNDKFYLTTCFVCQELAKPGTEHIRNYGGIVCFSCRQFFRRAHQKTQEPNFVCPFSGTCTVTVASRRRCQKCRHTRCLAAGMTPNAVLSPPEKDVRFRKYNEKKKKLMAMGIKPTKGNKNKTHRNSNATGDDDESAPSTKIARIKSLLSTNGLALPISTTSVGLISSSGCDIQMNLRANENPIDLSVRKGHIQSILSTPVSPIPFYKANLLSCPTNAAIILHQNPNSVSRHNNALLIPIHVNAGGTSVRIATQDNSMRAALLQKIESMKMKMKLDEENNPWLPQLERKVNLIVERYNSAITQNQSSQCLKLMAVQSGDCNINIDKEELLQHLDQISKQFHQFALSNSQFTRLPMSDQEKILSHNTPLFLQLYLSYFFVNENGSAILDHIMQCSNWNLSKQPFSNWLFALRTILSPNAGLTNLAELLISLRALRLDRDDVKAVLANTILFYSNAEMNLSNELDLEDIQLLNKIMFLSCKKKELPLFQLEEMISVLRKLSVMMKINLDWSDGMNLGVDVTNFADSSRFTNDENLWLENHLIEENQSLKSVSFTQDSLKEFLIISVGVPASQNFKREIWKTFEARSWSLITFQPEFRSLPLNIKKKIWKESCPVGILFQILQKECLSTGMQQLKDEFDGLDALKFEDLCQLLFSGCNQKKTKLWQKTFMQQQLETGTKRIFFQDLIIGPEETQLHGESTGVLVNSTKTEFRPYFADPMLAKLIMILSAIKPSEKYLPAANQFYLRILSKYLETKKNSSGGIFWKAQTIQKNILTSIINFDEINKSF